MNLVMRNGGPGLVDDEDAPLLEGWGWHVMSTGYIGAMTGRSRGTARTMILLHRHLMKPPDGLWVDHINGNRLDNRRSNLRLVTPTMNTLNRHRLGTNNRSGVLGVSWCKAGWRATIKVQRRQIELGTYKTVEAAARARWAGEIHYFGTLFPLSQQARLRIESTTADTEEELE